MSQADDMIKILNMSPPPPTVDLIEQSKMTIPYSYGIDYHSKLTEIMPMKFW